MKAYKRTFDCLHCNDAVYVIDLDVRDIDDPRFGTVILVCGHEYKEVDRLLINWDSFKEIQ